jgi:hypothetical protein
MNHISQSLVALALPLGLAACTSGPEAGDFAAACNETGNLSTELCDCLDAQAQDLSPETHEFVIATIAEDENRARELALGLDSAQQLEAGQYLSIAIQQCIIDLPETS